MTTSANVTIDDPTPGTDHAAELPTLSIVVPCFNEAESLEKLAAALANLRAVLAGQYRTELVLVDDGSRDDTWRLLNEKFAGQPATRLLRHDVNRGIAAAIGAGICAASSEVVASIDADCTYDPLQIAALLMEMGEDVDVVVASPYHPAGQVIGVPAWRLWLSRLASRLYSLVMRNQLHTYTSCFRVYRKSSVSHLPLSRGGFVGVVELLWQLDRRGGAIAECPAVLTVRTTGHSKMRIVRTALAHFGLLAEAAWHRLVAPVPPRGPKRVIISRSNESSRFAPRAT